MAEALRVVPIVEGHGEVEALPILLRRIGIELLGNKHIAVATPIRQARSSLLKADKNDLHRALRLATEKLKGLSPADAPTVILILLDAEDDCPARLRVGLIERAAATTTAPVRVVFAKVEYETWLAASAEKLGQFLDDIEPAPTLPEEQRVGKKWVQDRFKAGKYSERIDQPRLTAAIDLNLCRQRCPSFDKLCRDLSRACYE